MPKNIDNEGLNTHILLLGITATSLMMTLKLLVVVSDEIDKRYILLSISRNEGITLCHAMAKNVKKEEKNMIEKFSSRTKFLWGGAVGCYGAAAVCKVLEVNEEKKHAIASSVKDAMAIRELEPAPVFDYVEEQ